MERKPKRQKCLIFLAALLSSAGLFAAEKEIAPPEDFRFPPVIKEKVRIEKEILHRLTPVFISWGRNDDSNAFEVQIALDESFTSFNSIFVSRPSARLKFRRLGTQYIRVRPIQSKTETTPTGNFSKVISVTVIRELESSNEPGVAARPLSTPTPKVEEVSSSPASPPMTHRWTIGAAVGQGLSHEKALGISTKANGVYLVPELNTGWIGTKGKMEFKTSAYARRASGFQGVSLPFQWGGDFSVLRKSITPIFSASHLSAGVFLAFDSWGEPTTALSSTSTSMIYLSRKVKTGTFGLSTCFEKNVGFEESSFCLKVGRTVWSSVENGGDLISMLTPSGWKGALYFQQPLSSSSSRVSLTAGIDAFKLSNQSDNQILMVNGLLGIKKEF
jgi:hypothetical protein